MDELPQGILAELRHYAPDAGVIRQALDTPHDVGDEASADVRYTLFGVPDLNSPEIGQCRLGEPYVGGHALLKTELNLGLTQGNLPPRLQIGQAFDHRTHESALLLACLEVHE